MGAVGALVGGLLVAAGGQPDPPEDRQADIDPAICWVDLAGRCVNRLPILEALRKAAA
jgi:hypothetical protein